MCVCVCIYVYIYFCSKIWLSPTTCYRSLNLSSTIQEKTWARKIDWTDFIWDPLSRLAEDPKNARVLYGKFIFQY